MTTLRTALDVLVEGAEADGRPCGCNESEARRVWMEQAYEVLTRPGIPLREERIARLTGYFRRLDDLAEGPEICCDRGLETGHRGKCEVAS